MTDSSDGSLDEAAQRKAIEALGISYEAYMEIKAEERRVAEGLTAARLLVTPEAIKRSEEAGRTQLRELAKQNTIKYAAVLRVSDIETMEQLQQRMVSYIDLVYTIEKRGVRLFELNKRFGVKARKFLITVCDSMTDVNARTGEISQITYGGSTVYFPTRMTEDLWKIESLPDKAKYENAIYERAYTALLR